MSPDEVPSTLTGALTGPPIQSSPHMPAPCLFRGGPFLALLFFFGGGGGELLCTKGLLYPKPATTKQTTTAKLHLPVSSGKSLSPCSLSPSCCYGTWFFFFCSTTVLPTYFLVQHACLYDAGPSMAFSKKGIYGEAITNP